MAQSYKIFIKDVPLLVTEGAMDKHSHAFKVVGEEAEPEIGNIIQEAISTPGHAGFFFSTSKPDEFMDKLRESFKLVVSAGGIVWNKNNELLMIYRRGKWDLPKGKVEENESIETAAIREVEEESGVGKLRLIQKSYITYHIYRENRKWMLKQTHWFEMLSTDTGDTIPQQSEGITKVKWVPASELQDKVNRTYASMRDLIEKVLQTGYISEHAEI